MFRSSSQSRGSSAGRLGVACVALLIVMLLSPTEALAQSRGRARMDGFVLDERGNPIAGAKVIMTHLQSGDQVEVETNDDGRFNKGSLGRGAWSISVSADGFLPGDAQVTLSAARRMKAVQITLVGGDAAGISSSPFSDALIEAVTVGNAMYDAGDHAGALAFYENTLATFDPDKDALLYQVHIPAGNAAFELQQYPEATAHYEAVLAVEPDNADANIGVVRVMIMERKIDEALAKLDTIDPAKVTDALVYYNVGTLLYEQGRSSDAAKYYELALQKQPDFADAHLQLAICYIQQSMMNEAKPHLERVLELDAGSANAALAQDFLNAIQ